MKLAACLALGALSACGTTTSPSASGVFPEQGFTGRALRLEISGDGTRWHDGVTVSLGDGIEVNDVEVASPTALFVTITVDPAAALGKRDVVITGGGTFTLTNAFELVPPVTLQLDGNPGQGGRPSFDLVNRDFEHPFDLTRDPATADYAKLALVGPDKVALQITSANEYTIHGRAFIDLDAASGPLTLTSGALASMPGDFTVLPRTPTPLTGPTTGAITALGDSALYSIASTGSPSLVHVAVHSSAPSAAVSASIFTDSTWTRAVGMHEVLATAATVTFVVADVQGASGYEYDLTAAGEPLALAPEGDDGANGSPAGALAAGSLPFEQASGSLSSASDLDLIAFTIDAAHAMKRVHVVTDAGDDRDTDTKVDVTDAAGTTSYLQQFSNGHAVDGSECGIFGCFTGDPLGEDVISDPLPAGTYYVRISPGAAYAPAHRSYATLVWLE